MFIKQIFPALLISFCAAVAYAQNAQPGSIALSPARFDLEMKPGSETTVVVDLDYRGGANAQPSRIVASLNDWNLTPSGQIQYSAAGTLPGSASPWMIYTPGEASVIPGTTHQIRVTISVPENATPGDHLAALIVEPRPESLRAEPGSRSMIVRYRMASVFYIKVAGLTRKGELADLTAQATADGIVVTPQLKNSGNSVVRPLQSVEILGSDGKMVASLPEFEALPVLANAETRQSVNIAKVLSAGTYTIKYRVDFQDGERATEGVTSVFVSGQLIATAKTAQQQ